jgi:hypothetical protein
MIDREVLSRCASVTPAVLFLLIAGCWDATIFGTQIEVDTYSTDSNAPLESDTDTGTDTGSDCGVPSQFQWSSTGPLISSPATTEDIKDPSVVFFNGQWHVYATTNAEDLTLTYVKFSDWATADQAEKKIITENTDFSGYVAAPQLFYFEPHNLWYLVFQAQDQIPSYATAVDPGNVRNWSAPMQLMPMPALLTDNEYQGIDYWTICDDVTCYLFFTALNGILYRSSTPKSDFPNGFEGTTKIVMKDDNNPSALFDACNVYRLADTGKYLLLVSAIGGTGRYSRSWTADRLDGEWTALADTEANSFASMNNAAGADWSHFGISHGEMLRLNPDETMTIDTCNMQFLFSGLTDTGYELGLLSLVR